MMQFAFAIKHLKNYKLSVICFALFGLYMCSMINKERFTYSVLINYTDSMEKGKALSHRLRGFSDYELSASALEKAIESGIKYLEIDVRASSDNVLYLYHDPCTGKDTSETFCFSSTNSNDIKKVHYKNSENIIPLETALNLFKMKKKDYQILCIDIKDYGYEKNYVNLVKKFELEDNTIFISWIPQTIIGLNQLSIKSPLILSHFNFTNYYWFIGDIISYLFKNSKISLLKYVILGSNRYNDSLTNIDKGYQHCLLSQQLPSNLESILSSSKGGICIPKNMLSQELIDYCKEKKLKIWIFSVTSVQEFKKYSSNDQINVIFCDFLKNE